MFVVNVRQLILIIISIETAPLQRVKDFYDYLLQFDTDFEVTSKLFYSFFKLCINI